MNEQHFNYLSKMVEEEAQSSSESLQEQIPKSAQNNDNNKIDSEISSEGGVTLTFLRKRLPSLWDLYLFLKESQDVYLPRWQVKDKPPKFARQKYLEGVLMGKFFQVKRSQISKQTPKITTVSKSELLRYLEEVADKPLGFEGQDVPTVRWIVKVLYSIDPEHRIFKKKAEKMKHLIPADVLEKLKTLPEVRLKGSRAFFVDAKERRARRIENLKRMKEREVLSIEEAKRDVERRKKKIEELERMIIEAEKEEKGLGKKVKIEEDCEEEEEEHWDKKKRKIEEKKGFENVQENRIEKKRDMRNIEDMESIESFENVESSMTSEYEKSERSANVFLEEENEAHFV